MKNVREIRQELAKKASESEEFRAALISDPKAVLAREYGVQVPKSVTIAVHQDSANAAHLILPPAPRMTAAELQRVSGGTVEETSELTKEIEEY